eukprot:PhF_6_TR16547/c0_g1_i1/m.25247/K10427/DCTN5; dynactin 5
MADTSQDFVQYHDHGFDDPFPAVILGPKVYSTSQFVQTKMGMKIAVSAKILGREQVKFVENCVIQSDSVLRADLRRIDLGSYCYLDTRCILRPFSRVTSAGVTFFPMKLGNFVYVGSDCVVEAAAIGSYVIVESNVILGARCQLSDICKVLKNSVVMPDTVVPSFCVYGGNPAVFIRHLHEGARGDIQDVVTSLYTNVQIKPT